MRESKSLDIFPHKRNRNKDLKFGGNDQAVLSSDSGLEYVPIHLLRKWLSRTN